MTENEQNLFRETLTMLQALFEKWRSESLLETLDEVSMRIEIVKKGLLGEDFNKIEEKT